MTKTRLQFLLAIFLITLPFLGFPVWLDNILVSLIGLSIATTTFLAARERRLKTRSVVLFDPADEQKQTASAEVLEETATPKKTRRTASRLKKKAIETVESNTVLSDEDDGAIEPVLEETESQEDVLREVEQPIPSPLLARVRRPRIRSRVATFIGNDSGE